MNMDHPHRYPSKHEVSQQKRHIERMLVQCWPTVYNAGPTIVNRLVFAANGGSSTLSASTKKWPNAGLILGRRLRRWANIKPQLG